MNRTFVSLALIAWLSAGLAVKGVRYGRPEIPLTLRTEKALVAMLAEKGWSERASVNIDTDSLVSLYEFSRPSCETGIRISTVGLGDATLRLVQRDLGPDIEFAYAGATTPVAPLGGQTRAALRAAFESLAGGAFSSHAPIIAISPSAGHRAGDCDPQIAERWNELEQRISAGS